MEVDVKNKNLIAMIPARLGSTRLKMKNLALINGKPMIYYAVQAAKDSEVFNQIVINSDSELFEKIAVRYGVDFYLRPKQLGGSNIKSDDVVFDFVNNHNADIIAWVNPIAPFQTGKEIHKVVNDFLERKLDSLITVEEKQVHCICDGKPVNYNPDESFAKTQDIISVHPFTYSVMMWRSEKFLTEYNKNGHGFFCGNFGVHPVNQLTSLIIKTQNDLIMANLLMKNKGKVENNVKYDELANLVLLTESN